MAEYKSYKPIHPAQHARNLWLSGARFEDVEKSPHYHVSDIKMKSEMVNSFAILDHAFEVFCHSVGIDFEPARVVRTLKKPPEIKQA